MIFGKFKEDIKIQVKNDNVEIERVKEYKFLGFILSHNLSWEPQICSIQTKIAKNIATLQGKKRFTSL